MEEPCRCDACGGYSQGACKYAGVDPLGPHLTLLYSTYVEHGNTPLISLPTWMADVARQVRHYRNLSERRRANDDYERAVSREMLKRALGHG